MDETTKELPVRIENPFEKVTAEQLNHDLIAYLFAKPEVAVYDKLINRENYRIIGGWGSGKTTLLKHISFEGRTETLGLKVVREVLSISEMGHFLNRTLWYNQAALASSLRPWL